MARIFGNPQKEDQVMRGDGEPPYYMAYDYMGYSLAFYRSSPNGKVEWFEISNKKNHKKITMKLHNHLSIGIPAWKAYVYLFRQ